MNGVILFFICCSILEAVNLELVNLNTPASNGRHEHGIPMPEEPNKKGNISQRYDEYFVPVNEHRKYIRYDFPHFHLTSFNIKDSYSNQLRLKFF